MWRKDRGSPHFYVYELAQKVDDYLVMPLRWVRRGGRVQAKVANAQWSDAVNLFLLLQPALGTDAFTLLQDKLTFVDINNISYIDADKLVRPYPNLSPVVQKLDPRSPFVMPNPLRNQAAGAPMYTSFMSE